MAENEDPLIELRQEIDSIDAEIHDLIMRRTALIGRVGDAKPGAGSKMRPAREAEIIRRLVARHAGAFPALSVVRIWREIISAFTGLQGPFAAAVFAPEDRPGYWDLARDHYGSSTPMSAHATTRSVVEAVTGNDGVIGILPRPSADREEFWWRHLAGGGGEMVKVVARLPFAGPGSLRDQDAEALVIAKTAPQPTGRDRTYLIIEIGEDVPARNLITALKTAGLESAAMGTWRESGSADWWLHLAECEGFVAADDDRLAGFGKNFGASLGPVSVIGAYAEGLSASDLAGRNP